MVYLSSLAKKKDRLRSKPSDYTYDEIKSLLTALNFIEKQGKGSRVKFTRISDSAYISFDKPHGKSKTLKVYIINNIIRVLKEKGDL